MLFHALRVLVPALPVFAKKKRPLRKFDAKASFEVRSTASDVVFREESEFEVKNGPKLLKTKHFLTFENFENLKILKILKLIFSPNF